SWGFTFLTIVFIKVIYSGFSSFYGWSFYEMLILLSAGQIAFYLFWILTPGANTLIGGSVVTGELDRFLIKPFKVSIAMSVYGADLISLLPSLILQIGIMFYAFYMANIQTSFIQVLVFIFSVFISFFLTFFMNFVVNVFSFFSPYSYEGARSALNQMQDIQKYPADIYSNYLKPIFMFFIPFGLISYVPTYNLIKKLDLNLIFLQLLSCLFLFLVSSFLWKRGLKSYTGAGG
ncbi:ABC-2 family transporter protein, partial [Patescibacteria group bacterium]|nr:ABC-2 family transporter protein [Patescibacteria group bacterium]